MCETVSDRLLAWYDTHARQLPWRVGPVARNAGVRPDPYKVWLSEIMLQQTTVVTVVPYFNDFTTRWPTVHHLASEEDAVVMAAWAGLGYYARARNLLKCARLVSQNLGGQFPQSDAGLRELPGIGPYTAAAILSIAFDIPAGVVDGNVERVMARFHAIQTPLPKAKPDFQEAALRNTPQLRAGDYAQAVMDLGAMICTPKSPKCGDCPLSLDCDGRAQGIAHSLPAKSPKPAKPIRFGTAFVAVRNDGAWLLERRAERGLLGGMLGWPGSEWAEKLSGDPVPPCAANWSKLPVEVRHTFTHFHLRLNVQVAKVSGCNPRIGEFRSLADFERSDLPTVMRKVFDVAQRHLGDP